MPGSSCRGTMDCQRCPRAVDNEIVHAFHSRGFHMSAHKCEENIMIFLLKGEILINSEEYAGTTLRAGEFILQAIGSKFEVLVMADSECICYSFNKPELICEDRFNHIVQNVPVPLIYSPLKIMPELRYFLEGSGTYMSYLNNEKICGELLTLKRKELSFILSYYYSDIELATLAHPLSHYTNSFQCFVIENHFKVKTVEEFAHLGGYTATTFRRIFNTVFHEPVYEWMVSRRKEAITYDLYSTHATISEICYKYGFESLPHFSNFCKKNFGASPRKLRKGSVATTTTTTARQALQPTMKVPNSDDISKAWIRLLSNT